MFSGKIIKPVCQLSFCPQNSINPQKGTKFGKIADKQGFTQRFVCQNPGLVFNGFCMKQEKHVFVLFNISPIITQYC